MSALHQVKQAELRRKVADGVVTSWLAETYEWLLVPGQPPAEASPELQAFELTGQEPLAHRTSRNAKKEEPLIPSFAALHLRTGSSDDQIPLLGSDTDKRTSR